MEDCPRSVSFLGTGLTCGSLWASLSESGFLDTPPQLQVSWGAPQLLGVHYRSSRSSVLIFPEESARGLLICASPKSDGICLFSRGLSFRGIGFHGSLLQANVEFKCGGGGLEWGGEEKVAV